MSSKLTMKGRGAAQKAPKMKRAKSRGQLATIDSRGSVRHFRFGHFLTNVKVDTSGKFKLKTKELDFTDGQLFHQLAPFFRTFGLFQLHRLRLKYIPEQGLVSGRVAMVIAIDPRSRERAPESLEDMLLYEHSVSTKISDNGSVVLDVPSQFLRGPKDGLFYMPINDGKPTGISDAWMKPCTFFFGTDNWRVESGSPPSEKTLDAGTIHIEYDISLDEVNPIPDGSSHQKITLDSIDPILEDLTGLGPTDWISVKDAMWAVYKKMNPAATNIPTPPLPTNVRELGLRLFGDDLLKPRASAGQGIGSLNSTYTDTVAGILDLAVSDLPANRMARTPGVPQRRHVLTIVSVIDTSTFGPTGNGWLGSVTFFPEYTTTVSMSTLPGSLYMTEPLSDRNATANANTYLFFQQWNLGEIVRPDGTTGLHSADSVQIQPASGDAASMGCLWVDIQLSHHGLKNGITEDDDSV